jgi:hypothetical protein
VSKNLTPEELIKLDATQWNKLVFAAKRRRKKQYIPLHEYLRSWDLINAMHAELAKSRKPPCR